MERVSNGGTMASNERRHRALRYVLAPLPGVPRASEHVHVARFSDIGAVRFLFGRHQGVARAETARVELRGGRAGAHVSQRTLRGVQDWTTKSTERARLAARSTGRALRSVRRAGI